MVSFIKERKASSRVFQSSGTALIIFVNSLDGRIAVILKQQCMCVWDTEDHPSEHLQRAGEVSSVVLFPLPDTYNFSASLRFLFYFFLINISLTKAKDTKHFTQSTKKGPPLLRKHSLRVCLVNKKLHQYFKPKNFVRKDLGHKDEDKAQEGLKKVNIILKLNLT